MRSDDPNGQNDRTDLDQENQFRVVSVEARESDLDLVRRSPYRPAASEKCCIQRPYRRPHSITRALDQKLLAQRAATTEDSNVQRETVPEERYGIMQNYSKQPASERRT